MRAPDLRIGTHLALGLGAMIAVCAVEILVVGDLLGDMRELRRRQDEVIAPRARAAARIERGTLYRAIAMRNVALSPDDDDVKAAATAWSDVRSAIAEARALPPDQDRPLLLRIVPLADAYEGAGDEFIAAARRRAPDLLEREAAVAAAREELAGAVHAYAARQEEKVLAIGKEIAVLEDRLRAAVLWFGVALVAVLAAAAWWVARAVRDPAARLARAARALATGDSSPALALDGGDGPEPRGELAQLARTFARMARELVQREEDLAEANSTLQAQNEELQAQGEELQGQAEELQAQGEELRAQQEQLEAQASEMRAQNDRLRTALDQLAIADRRKDEFLAMLGHELRNPLAAVAGAARLLGERRPDEGAVRSLVGVVTRQVSHLSRLVDDLLDVSRITRGALDLRRERVDLREPVRHAVDACRPILERKAQAIGLDLGERPLVVDGDPARLEQIAQNLVHNAAKFSPREARIDVSLADEGGEAVLRVRDTGVGMTPDQIARVFELFFQAKAGGAAEGLGIGLTLVRQLAELHGGRAEAASGGAGAGSTFTVRVPLAAAGEVRAPVQARAPQPGRLRVMLVEDNPDLSETTAMLLEGWGHEVHAVATGRDAIASVRERSPDVVLVDIGLPDMPGYEVARAIRAQCDGRRPTLVAVTGYGQHSDRLKAEQAGFDAHLVKPVDPDALLEMLASLAQATMGAA